MPRYVQSPHAPVRCMSLSRRARIAFSVNPYYRSMGWTQRIRVDTADAARCLHGNKLSRQVVPSTNKIVLFERDDFCILSPWIDQGILQPCRTLRNTFRRKLCSDSCVMVRYLNIRGGFGQSCGLRGRLLSSIPGEWERRTIVDQ